MGSIPILNTKICFVFCCFYDIVFLWGICMGIEVGNFESQKYRKLFEFMKQYGVEPFQNFFNEYSEIEQQNLLKMAVLTGRHETLAFVRKHSKTLRMLREIGGNNSYVGNFLFSKVFMSLVKNVTDDNISQYIEGARGLETLGVANIFIIPEHFLSDARENFCGFTDIFCNMCQGTDYKVVDIVKMYTNGFLTYKFSSEGYPDSYRTFVSFPEGSTDNFIIKAENHSNGSQYRYARISGFSFDPSLLPSEVELASYEPPKSLLESKVYVKR